MHDGGKKRTEKEDKRSFHDTALKRYLICSKITNFDRRYENFDFSLISNPFGVELIANSLLKCHLYVPLFTLMTTYI